MAKTVFNKKENLFTSKSELNLRKHLVHCYTLSTVLYSAETSALRKIFRNILKILKFVAAGGRRWSIRPILWETKKYYVQLSREGTSQIQYNERRLTGLVTSCVGTAFWNTLLKKHREKGRGDGKTRKKIWSKYWMTVKILEYTVNWKRKH
jgi:hypothetical protein